ncbi:hypothetical protein A6R68_11365 [Neotoma lepida]|uniref:Uncharacterized protein n=1 Tax=Neotoma lepida TaxID=56216 RepID=A0A1A6FU82_NEOLE|nr:hypothetical protein A6R68_11365 [Neotoma lepida]
MSIHHKCADGLGPQRCMGKLPKGFRRYYSSPLLIHEQFGCIKEVMPIALEYDMGKSLVLKVFTYPENGTDDIRDQVKTINHQGPLSKDPLQMNTYVALYRFVPQENEDLEMRYSPDPCIMASLAL